MSRSSENDKIVTKQDNVYRQTLRLRKETQKYYPDINLFGLAQSNTPFNLS